MAADPKAVPISQLSLHQLDQFKSQLDEDVAMMTASLQQLKIVQQKLADSKESIQTVAPKNESKEILIPLTGSMYVPGKLKNTDSVIVDIGTGYYVEKNIKEADSFFQRKLDFVKKNLEQLQQGLMEKHRMRDGLIQMMKLKIQAQSSIANS